MSVITNRLTQITARRFGSWWSIVFKIQSFSKDFSIPLIRRLAEWRVFLECLRICRFSSWTTSSWGISRQFSFPRKIPTDPRFLLRGDPTGKTALPIHLLVSAVYQSWDSDSRVLSKRSFRDWVLSTSPTQSINRTRPSRRQKGPPLTMGVLRATFVCTKKSA